MKEWNISLLESENISTGDLKSRFKSRILMKEGKKSVWYENEIIEYNPYSHLRIVLKGGNLGKKPLFVTYDIVSVESGIKVNYERNWETNGFFMKLFSKQIIKAMDKNATNDLQELKNKLENK